MKLFFIGFVFFWSLISCADKVLESPTMPAEQTKTPGLKSGSIGYYVATTGNDNNPGTAASPFKTIQKAADIAVAGDIVYVRGGTYNEMVTFSLHSGTSSSPIQVMAYPGESPVIDGGTTLPSADYRAMIKIWSDYVNISGFEVKNVGTTIHYAENIAMQIVGSHCTVSHMTVHDCQSSGILAQGDYSVVEDCVVYNTCLENYNGVNAGTGAWGSGISAARDAVNGITDYAILRRNTVHDVWGEGISTFEATHTTFEDNIAYDCWATDYYISDASNCLVQRNFGYQTKVMTGGSQPGIYLADENAILSSYNTIINNIIYGCRRNLLAANVILNNVLIANNTFVNSSYYAGVQIFDTSPISSSFVNNIVTQNGGLSTCDNFPSSLTKGHNLWSTTPVSSASGTGDVIGDPKFTDITHPYVAVSYILMSSSPAINAGANLGLTTDYLKNAIVGLPDMGAIEYQSSISTSTVYYNIQESGTATKNDCTTGSTGSTVTYTVAAGKYSSTISQTDANNQAINDVTNNKQAYANANGTCTAATVYYNIQESGTATKNDCGTGYTGSTVTYTVAASKYSSIVSQADADSKAIADVTANKQTYANTNGTCTAIATTVYYNVQESGTATKNDCGTGYTGSIVTYNVAAGKYSSTISQTDANNQAIKDVNNNVQAYANANGTCTAITTTTTTTKTKKWWRR
jgi:hypothetical protein